MDYWYSGQLRNYRLQFIRAFSNFSYSVGTNPDGSPQLVRCPCRYGDPTRIAATIVKGNSENKLLTTPFITCWISGLSTAPNRRQGPQVISSVQVDTREIDPNTGQYLNTIGNQYSIARYMPVPYELSMSVDLWTPNESVKEQLVEQIMVLYNPGIEVQTSNNPIDWTVITWIEMQDQITWSSRTIPIGTDNPIDVLTMVFRFPIWISPPAQVTQQNIIQSIVTNIIHGNKQSSDQVEWTDYEFLSRATTTPGNFGITLTWMGNNQYAMSLTSSAGDQAELDNKATVTFSQVNPVLTPGLSFSFNGIIIPITTSNIATFVDNAAALMVNTSYNIQLQNYNQIMFINNTAGDNVFENVIGNPLAGLGLLPTTYPGGQIAWWRLFASLGNVNPYSTYGSNASQITVWTTLPNQDTTTTYQAAGWIDFYPNNQNLIIWTLEPDSVPPTTISPINAVIDPQQKGPTLGLPPPAVGQSYLLTNAPSQESAGWGQIFANANDIITFDGTVWAVTWSAANYQGNPQYVKNLFTGKLLEWNGSQWSEYILSHYQPGFWRVAL
jgi:hypothetical protein